MTPDRIFRALRRLYPRSFRDEYGDSLLETLHDMRASGRYAPLAFWRVVMVDIVCSATRAQLDACRSGPRRFALRWLSTCALGLIVTVLAADTVAWAFGYFYHPYFEGLTISPWGYGVCLGRLAIGGITARPLGENRHAH